jgi:hypothetical protein
VLTGRHYRYRPEGRYGQKGDDHMIRKLFQILALPDALTSRMASRERIVLALALVSVGYRCIAYGLHTADKTDNPTNVDKGIRG